MGGKPANNGERILLVETLTEENARAISRLTGVVEKLSVLVAKEDDRIKAQIHELGKMQASCQERQTAFMTALESKRELIKELKSLIDDKADMDDVIAIKKVLFRVMWGILGGVGAIVGSATLYYIEHVKIGG